MGLQRQAILKYHYFERDLTHVIEWGQSCCSVFGTLSREKETQGGKEMGVRSRFPLFLPVCSFARRFASCLLLFLELKTGPVLLSPGKLWGRKQQQQQQQEERAKARDKGALPLFSLSVLFPLFAAAAAVPSSGSCQENGPVDSGHRQSLVGSLAGAAHLRYLIVGVLR